MQVWLYASEPHDMIGIVNNSDIFTKIFHLSRGEWGKLKSNRGKL